MSPAPSWRRRVWLAAGVVAALAAHVVVSDADVGASSAGEAAPELPLGQPLCGVAPELAAARADTLAVVASSRAVRLAFDLRDGIVAHDLLAEAVACARLAPADGAARRLSGELGALTERLSRAYRARRLALRVALLRRDPARALPEVRALARAFAGSAHPYAAWLNRRRAELEAGGAAE